MFTLTLRHGPECSFAGRRTREPASSQSPGRGERQQKMMEMHKQGMEAMRADVQKMKSSLAQMKSNVATISDPGEKARWQT